MKKTILILFSILLISSCSKKNEETDINSILMSIKNYSCSMQIESFSNKNTVTYSANQTYEYPSNYLMEFNDSKTILSYNNGNLNITNPNLNIFKEIKNYQNLNTNPLFLSYFLDTYFNIPTENILTSSLTEVSIILPPNNPYLYKATLTLDNNIPNTITYFDKNGTPKVNIIYNEFKSESL